MADEIDTEHLTRKQKHEDRIVRRILDLIKDQGTQEGHASSGLRPEELTKFMAFMESARVIAASALLAAMLGAIYEDLSLMGVTDVSPARAVLVCAWLFGVMFTWELVMLSRWKRRMKGWVLGMSAIVLLIGFVSLDRWTVWWKVHHPVEIAQFTDAVQGMQSSIQQLTNKSSVPRVQEAAIKEIQPVPGYLKLDWGYRRLPLEQPDKATTFNVMFINRGSTYTHDSTMKGQLVYVDFHGIVPSPDHNEELSRRLKEQIDKMTFASFEDVSPGAALWSTYYAIVLTQAMYDAVEAGTSRVYFAAYAEWTTNKIPDHVKVCLWLQPVSWTRASALSPTSYDPTKAQPIWHTC